MQRSRKIGASLRAARIFAAPLVVAAFATVPAAAATLMVGPNQTYKVPSQAAKVVQPGDTVIITPATYHDCAVWTADNLVLESSAKGVILANTTCQGKGIWVIAADNVTVKGLTFTGAKVADGNGAGIRAEGTNLGVDSSVFSYNQDGILADDNLASTITITNSQFIHNGACVNSSGCAHGIYVGYIAALQISHTTFYDTQVGHHIKSRAATTQISNCDIEDGPNGTASYEVDIPYGGNLLITNSTMEKGPKSQNHTTAISIGESGTTNPTNQLLVTYNTFTNDGPPTVFVYNHTQTPAELVGNTLLGNKITPLVGAGTVK